MPNAENKNIADWPISYEVGCMPISTLCQNCGASSNRLGDVTFLYGTPEHVREQEQQWCVNCRKDYSFTCGHCGDRVSSSFRRNVLGNGQPVCMPCWMANYFSCLECGGTFNISEIHDRSVLRTRPVCKTCSESRIENYSYRVPTNIKLGEGPHYYGVELEVDHVRDKRLAAKGVNRAIGSLPHETQFATLKRDGSINGFEIVTVPASLDVHRETWPKILGHKDVEGKIKSWNTPSCGLHIHCSRQPLTEKVVSRIVLFMNASFNRQFIFLIAGRRTEEWARFHYKTEENALQPIEKYEAVNLLPGHTIEFRIFRGTVKPESLFKAIEFCDALIHFAKQRLTLSDSMKRSRFIKYVHEHAERYPHLEAFIQAKWFGRSTKDSEKFGYKPIKIKEVAVRRITDIEE